MATVNGMNVKAARGAGDIKPGGEAAVDVWVDGGLGNAAAARFWIGTEDAKGSVNAKTGAEDGKWHTHTEVSDPMPSGGRLWVEIEDKDGKTGVASFELRDQVISGMPDRQPTAAELRPVGYRRSAGRALLAGIDPS